VIVVADTTPLNYLVLMDRVDILRQLYRRVIIPHAVLHEMLADGAPLAVQEWAATLPHWVDVVSTIRSDETLSKRLGAGEREAI
jgi:predicted nucleic acid-binding protein